MKRTLAERVALALAGPPKRTQKALADACGITPTSVNDWLSGKTKSIEGANLTRASAFLGVNPKWLAEDLGPMRAVDAPPQKGGAHPMSHQPPDSPPIAITWEGLMDKALPEVFSIDVLDDAMAPLLMRGGRARFSTRRKAQPGRCVLVADSTGGCYIREYRTKRGDEWVAAALNPAYQPLDSAQDGLRVLAVLTGYDYPDE